MEDVEYLLTFKDGGVNAYAWHGYTSDDGVIVPSYQEDFGAQFVSIIAPKKLRRALDDNLDASLNEVGINTNHSQSLDGVMMETLYMVKLWWKGFK